GRAHVAEEADAEGEVALAVGAVEDAPADGRPVDRGDDAAVALPLERGGDVGREGDVVVALAVLLLEHGRGERDGLGHRAERRGNAPRYPDGRRTRYGTGASCAPGRARSARPPCRSCRAGRLDAPKKVRGRGYAGGCGCV